MPLKELAGLIQTVHQTLTGLGEPVPEPQPEPAVSVKRSVTDGFLVLSGLRKAAEDAEAAHHDRARHDPGRIPRGMVAAPPLPDGGEELLGDPAGTGRAERARS